MNRAMLQSQLPPVLHKSTGRHSVTNNTLIEAIENDFPKAVEQTKKIARHFIGRNKTATAKNVWDFVKTQVPYIKDDDDRQLGKLPNAFLSEGGDCKSVTLFCSSILKNLGFDVKFRYAGYDRTSNKMNHVYCVTKDERGNDIIVDPVWLNFNEEKYALPGKKKIIV